MTYNDFLNQFVGVISSFVSWLISVSNVLIHNYFFITIFGLALFCSFFWLVYHIFSDTIKHIIYGYDDYNNLYDYYVLKKQVQSDYLDNHYNDEYDLKYRYKVLDLQVMNGVYQNNYDLIKDNKIHNLQLNIDALKELKRINLQDNDDSNDNDVDMIVPNPPVNIASASELKLANLKQFDNELVNDINSSIDRISNDFIKNIHNKYELAPDSDLYLVNKETGEVINRFIDDKNYKKYDLYSGKTITEDNYIELIKHESELQDEDSLKGEYIGLGGY